jgi:hypothetical protein
MSVANVHQAEHAIPVWQDFLTPILTQHGAPTKFGTVHAQMKHPKLSKEDPIVRAATKSYAELLSRMIRDGKDAPYPTAASVSHMSRVFVRGGIHWAWQPVLYWASGHLRPFVETISTVDLHSISPGLLVDLLHALPGAIVGDERARRTWTLKNLQRSAFLRPAEANGRWRNPLSNDLAHAKVIAGHYELSYAFQRELVLQSLLRWAESVAKGGSP